MGIINTTPDSFYKESRSSDPENVFKLVEDMITNGVEIIDIGGYSSRPNSTNISTQEEIERTAPIIKLIHEKWPDLIISIDTFRSQVAEAAIKNGASMINDISGGKLDESILKIASKYKTPYCMMHMVGTPQNMTTKTNYNSIIKDINAYFSEQIEKALENGIKDIIIDPGFGFSKTIEQNFFLLKNLAKLKLHNTPILIGLSRKSMLYKPLNLTSENALNATTSGNTIALQNGANIIRVHDVKEARECVEIYNLLNDSNPL